MNKAQQRNEQPTTWSRNGHIHGCEWRWGDSPKQHSEECIEWQDTVLAENVPVDKAAVRKGQPVFRGFAMYFPKAIKAVAELSLQGNLQHHPDKDLHWDKSKSTDEADALMRHLIDAGPTWDNLDDDGMLHAQKVAWRAMALLERVLDRKV